MLPHKGCLDMKWKIWKFRDKKTVWYTIHYNLAGGFCAVQLENQFLGWVRVRNTSNLNIDGITFSVNIFGNIYMQQINLDIGGILLEIVVTWNTRSTQLAFILAVFLNKLNRETVPLTEMRSIHFNQSVLTSLTYMINYHLTDNFTLFLQV